MYDVNLEAYCTGTGYLLNMENLLWGSGNLRWSGSSGLRGRVK